MVGAQIPGSSRNTGRGDLLVCLDLFPHSNYECIDQFSILVLTTYWRGAPLGVADGQDIRSTAMSYLVMISSETSHKEGSQSYSPWAKLN